MILLITVSSSNTDCGFSNTTPFILSIMESETFLELQTLFSFWFMCTSCEILYVISSRYLVQQFFLEPRMYLQLSG